MNASLHLILYPSDYDVCMKKIEDALPRNGLFHINGIKKETYWKDESLLDINIRLSIKKQIQLSSLRNFFDNVFGTSQIFSDATDTEIQHFVMLTEPTKNSESWWAILYVSNDCLKKES